MESFIIRLLAGKYAIILAIVRKPLRSSFTFEVLFKLSYLYQTKEIKILSIL